MPSTCNKCEHKEKSVSMIERHKQIKHTNINKLEEKLAQQICSKCGFRAFSEFFFKKTEIKVVAQMKNTTV